jgi:hypothetical protein
VKKRKKHRKVEQAIVKLPPPPKMRETKFMRVLDGWRIVTLEFQQNGAHRVGYIVSPTKKVYRRAFAWEKPSLVIDADILPAEHHIRLVRETNTDTCRLARKALRRDKRLQRSR